MKKIITLLLTLVLGVSCMAAFSGCKNKDDEIIVYTNAFFAPFEYYRGTEIVGVDVEIMNKVGEKMGKKVTFVDKDFDILIDTVAEGKVCDCAAAGITITDARKEKVNFSIPYYTAQQFVIFADGAYTVNTDEGGNEYVLWSALAGKKIGVQRNTTGDIYTGIEINGDGEEGTEDYYPGELNGTGATVTPYDNAQLAFEALKAGTIDAVIIDEMPAQYLVKNESAYKAAGIYYDAETATTEEYAIAVNKDMPDLLKAINEVLEELLAESDSDGNNGIEKLVKSHFGV